MSATYSTTPSRRRWTDPEYIIYFIVLIYGYYWQISHALKRSEEFNSGTQEDEGVQPGWFLGRKQDLSDVQWRVWRSMFPLLAIGLTVFVTLSNYLKTVIAAHGRIIFYNILSLLMLVALHGSAVVFIYLAAMANYFIAKIFGKSRLTPTLTWLLNVFVLWTSYIYEGYRYAPIFGNIGEVLDQHRGILNWDTYFKISMLRFISFNMDYYWMMNNRPVGLKPGRNAYFIAQETPHHKAQYDLLHFLAYAFYGPLYVAGPIVSFNAFVAQVYNPSTTYTKKKLWLSLVHILFVLLCFEIALHYLYYYAFNTHGLWRTFKTYEVCITGYFVLNFMYHKFLIIWRIFRLGAMFDGIDTPENMNRCVSNNYTFTGFWRSWHGSFNAWTVRYLYVPLGGRKTQQYTIWLIFLFIGLWHDLWINWVVWAMLNCMFFSMEIMIMTYFSRLKWLNSKWYYRHVVGVAGSFNVFLLMIANLAILHGYTDSVLFLSNAFLVPGGLATFLLAWMWLFCGVMIMQEVRAEEERSSATKRF